jgi:hypothetical protein
MSLTDAHSARMTAAISARYQTMSASIAGPVMPSTMPISIVPSRGWHGLRRSRRHVV